MVQGNQALDSSWAFVIDDRASEAKLTAEQEQRVEKMRDAAREALRRRRSEATHV